MSEDVSNDLEVMIPVIRTVQVAGKPLEIKPIKTKHLSKVIPLISPMIHLFMSNKQAPEEERQNLAAIAFSNTDLVVELLAVVLDKKPEEIGEFELDELLNVFEVFVEVNADFFIEKVIPSALRVMGQLRGALVKGRANTVGQTASKS